ncbi:unnamed protein product [Pleuronectes platessa]|uniref:Uncharacterized protein n=1 Tax=Pleuronectes platessa TaxID=8262 RepID=A0A9N7UHX1_PLEPL|nr:unnamed protein product [Pleuronectes platessa]
MATMPVGFGALGGGTNTHIGNLTYFRISDSEWVLTHVPKADVCYCMDLSCSTDRWRANQTAWCLCYPAPALRMPPGSPSQKTCILAHMTSGTLPGDLRLVIDLCIRLHQTRQTESQSSVGTQSHLRPDEGSSVSSTTSVCFSVSAADTLRSLIAVPSPLERMQPAPAMLPSLKHSSTVLGETDAHLTSPSAQRSNVERAPLCTNPLPPIS